MLKSVLIMRTYNSISALDFAIYFVTGKAEKSAVVMYWNTWLPVRTCTPY